MPEKSNHAALAAPSALRFKILPPLSLYIHIPWCVKKCPYCDFNSHEARGGIPEQAYVDALVADLEQALPAVWGRRVHTVFFGGGTPSLLSAGAVDAVLGAVRARLPLVPDAEITLEANPGTFEAEKFRAFRSAGINRLSVGIQSFNARHLKALGRVHDADQARRACEIACRTFDNVNLDLMYGLPDQSLPEAMADIDSALSYGPQHLSAYHLTIEPNTLFHRRPPVLPADDDCASMQEEIEAALGAAGFRHYETSAFARAEFRCQHNLNYWEFGDYLGIGAGAHGKISFPDRVLRQMRFKQPAEYMTAASAGHPVQREVVIAPNDMGFEFMMNALRLNEGFALRLFEERAGLPIAQVLRELESAESRKLVERDHIRVAPTRLGQRFLNDLLQLFLRQ